ncbi:RyR domain-containing protein [Priestia aryabhattai]|uniref:RyR domain-containing protein n=1 Tax=Priestia aryabhattai TaxID=412384 RepID=UPI00065400D4|nr:RyR domain-containing protein [Priestia aryabhattai]KMN92356.1 Ryanodine receptor Ryr [Priestia aryabhattai]
MSYKPKTINTSKVTLNTEVLKLTELLAENTHNLWAQQRINEGWVYGLKRDDVRKTHPGLIEYKKLPESEKEYDRITAMNTLKAIIALGYKIEKE